MGKGRPEKYNRITCQQKYMLRRLIMKEKISVKQAAQSLGINYSTAKTIMFFYRKASPEANSVFLSISPFLPTDSLAGVTAGYVEVVPSKPIQVLSSIGKNQWLKVDPNHESTDEQHSARSLNSL